MEEHAVSEIIGTLTLIGVVVLGIVIVNVVLLSRPPPARIPSFEGTIINTSQLITITHHGGDTLEAGQYKILVDGVDQTGNFTNSGGAGPFSAGETLSWNALAMPQRVVMIYNGTGTGEVQILATRFPFGVFLPPNTNTSTPTPIAPPALPPPYPLIVNWTNDPAFGNATSSIQFTDSSTGYDINAYFWDFNDGNTSTAQSPAHTFPNTTADSFMYSINHSATDSSVTSWLNRSSWMTIYKNLTPTVSFTQIPTSGQVPLAVSFDATWYGLIKVDSWLWNFGDSSSSTSEDPSHTYRIAGHYTVTLTGTNYTLGQTTVTKTSLITASPYPSWYSCNWLYRKNITLNGTAVVGTQNNFPVLISLSDSDLSTDAQPDGDDILFTFSDGTTRLPHQIESYASGALVAWVNVSSLTSAANTTIYMYYGNGTVGSQEWKALVWDPNYKGVWHLNENPAGTAPQMKDSTTNGNDGTSAGSMTAGDQVTAKIGGGLDLDGGNDEIACTNNASIRVTPPLTLEAWAKPWDYNRYEGIAGKLVWGSGNYKGYSINKVDSNNRYRGMMGSSGSDTIDSNSVYTDSNWHHIVLVRNTTAYLYVDGAVQTDTSTQAISDSGNSFRIGRQYADYNGRWWYGVVDEVRISNIARDSTWIKTEYNNQVNPALFHYPQPEEGWTC
jgi:PKD repeat protein